ncbi:hypothetical protein QVD17_09332 [Tagetes erecta]|uniref:Uncharacterized protein n=1 Tax=Tagetes erecta TaxID=13708 RepID=A0AAD8P579_TARER|nr:hypothetical protein QVD17_09332 [Tagetes erecta]
MMAVTVGIFFLAKVVEGISFLAKVVEGISFLAKVYDGCYCGDFVLGKDSRRGKSVPSYEWVDSRDQMVCRFFVSVSGLGFQAVLRLEFLDKTLKQLFLPVIRAAYLSYATHPWFCFTSSSTIFDFRQSDKVYWHTKKLMVLIPCCSPTQFCPSVSYDFSILIYAELLAAAVSLQLLLFKHAFMLMAVVYSLGFFTLHLCDIMVWSGQLIAEV